MTKKGLARYLELVREHPLLAIETEGENEAALDILKQLMRKGDDNLSEGELMYMKALSALVGEFENRTYDLGPPLSPSEMLRELMAEWGLKQQDLAEELGGQATVSLVLNEKRAITPDQAKKLAQRFRVAPILFLDQDLAKAPQPRAEAAHVQSSSKGTASLALNKTKRKK